MKATTLVENLTYQSELVAEHGLSIYIETENKRILFDTGQTDAFIRNAQVKCIDLAKVDALILSHGHYDHAGGVNAFLKINTTAKVYLKRAALSDKYHGHSKYIGAGIDAQLADGRLVFVDSILEIDKGLFIVPDTPIKTASDTHFEGFFVRDGGSFVADTFDDELFVVAESADGISILSSCSHRGITNIVEAARKIFSKKVKTILGGFHLIRSTDAQQSTIADYIEHLEPERVGICHCTGVDGYAFFKQRLGDRVFYSSVGSSVDL